MHRFSPQRPFWFACLVSLCVAGTVPLHAAEGPDPYDWPHWRGPEQNGISREKGLIDKWSPDGENVVWKKPEYGTRSTPIVMKNRLYTLCRHLPETTKEAEKVVCLDAKTGEKIWENVFNVFLSDAPAERVGWSSVVGDPATNQVFALGLCGLFQCIDAETGKTVWSHSMSEEYGMLTTYGGRTNFPVVFEDLVIISGVTTGWGMDKDPTKEKWGQYAVPAHRFIAFDKRTGQAVWIQSTRLRPEDTTYSTPIFGVFKGQAAMVLGAGDGSVYALQPRTGKVIWKYDLSIRGINTTPVVTGDKVFIGHAEENISDNTKAGSVICLDGTGSGDITKVKGKTLWDTLEITVGRSAPLLLNDSLYATSDSATISILNAKTGKEVGKQKLGTIMFGSLVYGDGKIYAAEASGRWYIFQPQGNKLKTIHKLRLENEEILGSPIISHGNVYLPTVGALYCLGKKDQTPSADPIPPAPQEDPTTADSKPAHIQIAPVESLLKTGQKQSFHVRVYNKNGRFLKTAPAKFTAEGPGSIDAEGVFTAPAGAAHTATKIVATVDGMTSSARIRTIPPLPWSFDFSDKQVPLTWIGAANRHQVREENGNPYLVKVTTIPKGTRSQSWMGPTTLHDYTIQADLKGQLKNGKLPDMGLIDQRYTLDLMGASQQLQIRSWTPRLELRFAKNAPYQWKENIWYTVKFQSENKDGKAILRGKVWPRDEKEPEAWLVEGTDEAPNVVGSPGLFGNANDAEISIDNVKVYPNQAATK